MSGMFMGLDDGAPAVILELGKLTESESAVVRSRLLDSQAIPFCVFGPNCFLVPLVKGVELVFYLVGVGVHRDQPIAMPTPVYG